MPYQASDPSEKTSISFYLGMTLTKLFAEVLFGVPRVLHLRAMCRIIRSRLDKVSPVQTSSDSPTEEIGTFLRPRDVQTDSDAQALATAKDQAEQIISIDNLSPVCSVACQAYFSPSVAVSGWMIQRRREMIDLERSRLADRILYMPTTIPFAG